VIEVLRPALWREGKWYADYRRLRILAIKGEEAAFGSSQAAPERQVGG
jgi:hypothetical protein